MMSPLTVIQSYRNEESRHMAKCNGRYSTSNVKPCGRTTFTCRDCSDQFTICPDGTVEYEGRTTNDNNTVTSTLNLELQEGNNLKEEFLADLWKESQIGHAEELNFALANISSSDETPGITVYIDNGSKCSSSENSIGAIYGFQSRRLLYVGIRGIYCSFCEFCKQENESAAPPHVCFLKDPSASVNDVIAEGLVQGWSMYGMLFNVVIGPTSECVNEIVSTATKFQPRIEINILQNSSQYIDVASKKISAAVSRDFAQYSPDKAAYFKQSISAFVSAAVFSVKSSVYQNTNSGSVTGIRSLQEEIKHGISAHLRGSHVNCKKHFCNVNPEKLLQNIPLSFRIDVKKSCECFLEKVYNSAPILVNSFIGRHSAIFGELCKHISCLGISKKNDKNTSVDKSIAKKRCSEESVVCASKRVKPSATDTPVQSHSSSVYETTNLVIKQEIEDSDKDISTNNTSSAFRSWISELTKESVPSELARVLKYTTVNAEDRKKILDLTTNTQIMPRYLYKLLKYRINSWDFADVYLRNQTSFYRRLLDDIRNNSLMQRKYTGPLQTRKTINNIKYFEYKSGLRCKVAGLYIHPTLNFLCGFPAALVENKDAILHTRSINTKQTFQKLARNGNSLLEIKKGELEVRKTSKEYIEIQGLLTLTEKSECYFYLRSEASGETFVKRIMKDNELCAQLESDLEMFYTKVVLPDIVKRYS